jgi:hypothetical protein
MKRDSEKLVSIGDWGAVGMIRISFHCYGSLSIAAFKVPQPPMPNQTPDPPLFQVLTSHHKYEEDIPYFDRSHHRDTIPSENPS